MSRNARKTWISRWSFLVCPAKTRHQTVGFLAGRAQRPRPLAGLAAHQRLEREAARLATCEVVPSEKLQQVAV